MTIQFKRGLAASLPAGGASGEPVWTTDTHVLYVGTGSGLVQITTPSYSDEQAQDAVGTILVDTATIDLTYNDGANTITADVVGNSISNSQLRQGIATSVVGRSANSTGNLADVQASSDNQFLSRRSGVLTWDTLVATDIPPLTPTDGTGGGYYATQFFGY